MKLIRLHEQNDSLLARVYSFYQTSKFFSVVGVTAIELLI